jgi:SAM-dependent methyltransferase
MNCSIAGQWCSACPLCGGTEFSQRSVLWSELVRAWELTPEQHALVDVQQGLYCIGCGATLRVMTLAGAILDYLHHKGTMVEAVNQGFCSGARILEINEAGHLHMLLRQVPGHQIARFPEVDIQRLPMADGSFDLVLHSDTLEHVQDPVLALRECLRVLRPGGAMLFTIPIVPSKLTRRRIGLPASYHGTEAAQDEGLRVRTEYGADFYLDMIAAGWRKISLFTLGSAASTAIVGVKQ